LTCLLQGKARVRKDSKAVPTPQSPRIHQEDKKRKKKKEQGPNRDSTISEGKIGAEIPQIRSLRRPSRGAILIATKRGRVSWGKFRGKEGEVQNADKTLGKNNTTRDQRRNECLPNRRVRTYPARQEKT